ncbi:MAG: hypothetical protein NTV46_11135 [Verrucomicrobia bacterium]|nr:hypothetical protein [Verrucomicrobiota bacterium]
MDAAFSLKSDRLEGEPGMTAGPRVKAEILSSGKRYLALSGDCLRKSPDFGKKPRLFRDQVDPETAEHANGQPEKPDGEQAVEGEGHIPKGCGT